MNLQNLGFTIGDESEIEFSRINKSDLNNTQNINVAHSKKGKCATLTESLLYSKNYKGGFRFTNKTKLTDYCINHSTKKSKYYLVDEKREMDLGNSDMEYIRGFCSKCAIRLAMNGLSIEEVLDENGQERKGLIEEFMDKLSKVQIKHEQKTIDNVNAKTDIEQIF